MSSLLKSGIINLSGNANMVAEYVNGGERMNYLSEEDFRRLWKSALKSVDTSALLFLKECHAPYIFYR
ncbi:hypothetical protein CG775_08645 [Paenibacillus polymyxa]|nr:hypothetical protein CG775_08645 [Paenibacillus polymyxa]